jgi:drug/metabolite transporter (DMT)-like permease
MSRQALPAVLLLGLLFGSTLIVSRYSVGQFAPTTYIWLRLLLSVLAFGAIYLFTRRRVPRDRDLWRQGIILGTLGTAVPMVGYVASLQYQSAGVTALLITTTPAVTVLFANFLLPDERLTARTALGIGLALSGAVLLAASGQTGLRDVTAASPLGYALVIGAITIDSLMVVYARKYARDLDTIDLSSVRMLAALVAVAPLSLWLVGFDLSAVTPLGYAGLVYAAAAGTFGGLLLSLWVTQRYGATTLSLTSYVIPVVAAVGGVLLLGETITPIMLVGMALIVAGLAFLNRKTAVPVELT